MAMASLAEFRGSRWMAILLSGDGEPYAQHPEVPESAATRRRQSRPADETRP
jgi:hypothetical protein